MTTQNDTFKGELKLELLTAAREHGGVHVPHDTSDGRRLGTGNHVHNIKPLWYHNGADQFAVRIMFENSVRHPEGWVQMVGSLDEIADELIRCRHTDQDSQYDDGSFDPEY